MSVLAVLILLVQADEDPLTFRAYWKDGPRFETEDKKFQIRLRVKMQLDAAWMSEDRDIERTVGVLEDGTEFRRARVGVSGRIYDNIIFSFIPDFAGSDVAFKAVYVGMDGLPLDGVVRVGHLKEPFSLESRTSASYATFAERALPTAIGAGRNVGVDLAQNVFGGRLSWAGGVYRETDNAGEMQDDGKANATVRLSGLPWDGEGGLIHTGFSYSRRNPNDSLLRYRARPEVHLAPRFIDTGDMAADDLDLYAAEGAVVWGPLSLQAEYVLSDVHLENGEHARFTGTYAFVSWFVTGERRAYDRVRARFTKLRPARNFHEDGGMGAWEVAARVSQLDLEDGGVSGGTLRDVSMGVNWYPNPVMRVTANGVYADVEGVGEAALFVMRFEINF